MDRTWKKMVRAVAFPLLRYFEPRFLNVYSHLDQVDSRIDRIERELPSIGRRMDDLRQAVAADVQVASEFLVMVQRSMDAVDQRLLELQRFMTSDLGKRVVEASAEVRDYAAGLITGSRINKLGEGTARLLNWAEGYTGFSAQKGLWFNPPVTVEYRRAGVLPSQVNERIVEVPFAMAVAGRLPPGSRVLDVGAAESTFALSLASLGLEVIALDPRSYPLAHPQLSVVEEAVQDWKGPESPLDAIFCISTLEHLGLASYGQTASDDEVDAAVMERLRGWLASRGELVLTVPYGMLSMDEFARTYDRDRLDALLQGWKLLERRICVLENGFWESLEEDPPPSFWTSEKRAVALVRATPLP